MFDAWRRLIGCSRRSRGVVALAQNKPGDSNQKLKALLEVYVDSMGPGELEMIVYLHIALCTGTT